MPRSEHHYGVWLSRTFVGTLRQRGDHVRFTIHPSYADDPHRPVLGLVFEQDLQRVHSAALRLPPWFSNLLPEGAQRAWIARQRGVSERREMELLAEVGHDLPGAVTVLPLPVDVVVDDEDAVPVRPPSPPHDAAGDPRGRFSLAGVQLKLSMVAAGKQLVVPLGGTLGDWIVKFPDANFPHLPVVEFVTMELARRSGIDVPETRLPTRDELPDTPDALWAAGEDRAFAIRRFDRGPDRSLLHIEDFAQVRDIYPGPGDLKYQGSYEILATLVHRGHDEASLREFVRRLAFNAAVDNTDAHLKNWSLLYTDPRRPVLSPAYDLVSVAPYPGYRGGPMALTLAGTKAADRLRLRHFDRLGTRSGLPEGELAEVAEATIAAVAREWPGVAEEHLGAHPSVRAAVDDVIRARTPLLRQ